MSSERRMSRLAMVSFALPLLLTGMVRGQSYAISSMNINSAGTQLIVVVNATGSTVFGTLSQASTPSNINVPTAFSYGVNTMPATTFAPSPVMQMVGTTPVQKVQYAKNKTQAWLFYSIANGSTLPQAIPYAATQSGNQLTVNINLINTGGSGPVTFPATPGTDGDIIIIDPCPPSPSQTQPHQPGAPGKTLPVVYYSVQPVYYVYPTYPGCGCFPARW